MRGSRSLMLLVLCLAAVSAGVVTLTVAEAQDGLAAAASLVALQQQPPAEPPPAGGGTEIDVDVDTGGGVWYTNPVWLVLGAAVVIAVIALLVSSGRSTTTVVK
jgi:hypothetical protein